MVTLVTGACGFVGSHMLALQETVPLASASERVDIRDAAHLSEILRDRHFDAVTHLAAQSFVPESFEDPETTFSVNFGGTHNLLRALRDIDFSGRVLFVGSGDMYGLVATDRLPIREDYPLKPRNPYAVSKVAAEALCYQWSQTGPFDVVMARPFNHIGPGQSERFAVSDFARQIAEIKLGRRAPVLLTGNIDVTRDFTDVRDVVQAYSALVESGRNGEPYNVCSGQERTLRSLVEGLLEVANVDVAIEEDGRRLRKAEQTRVWGSYAKLHDDTGWEPTIPIERSLRDILGYWEKTLDG